MLFRSPGGPDLDLGGGSLVGHAAEALGDDAGDGAGDGPVGGAVGVQCLGQPRPGRGAEDAAVVGVGLGLGVFALARRWMPFTYALAASLLLIGAPEVGLWARQVMLDVPAYAW